jgi:hypothetical protein
VACEPHTETITLSLDYGAALSPPGSLWSTRGGLIPLLVWADRRVMRGRTPQRIFNRRAATVCGASFATVCVASFRLDTCRQIPQQHDTYERAR